MNVDIGNIVIGKVASLPFVDKYAGAVKVLSYKDPASDNIVKRFPVDCNMDLENCKKGKRYLDLCPDDKKKSVMYLEDLGIRMVQREGNYTFWRSSFDLVCWLNLPKIGYQEGCSYSTLAIGGIQKKLLVQQFHALGAYQYITINIIGQRPKTENPFAKYSYDETVNQFLMYPYDYFVLNLEIDFRMDIRCFKITEIEDPANCLTH